MHFQHILDLICGAVNARTLFITQDGEVQSADTWMRAAAQVSSREPQPIGDLPNTKDRDILDRVTEVKTETRRIFTLWGSHYIKTLIAWETKKFGRHCNMLPGDIVIVLDRVLQHHYASAKRAIGRIIKVAKSGHQFAIKMASRGPGDYRPIATKSRKHLILLARAAENAHKPVHVDPLSDEDVAELLKQPRPDLVSEFNPTVVTMPPDVSDLGPPFHSNLRAMGPS